MKNFYEMIQEIVWENKSLTPREILEILNQEVAKGTFGKEYQENGWDLEDELMEVVFEIAQGVGLRIIDEFEEKHNIDLGPAHKKAMKKNIYMHFDEWDAKIEDFYKIYYGRTYGWRIERLSEVLKG